MTETSKITNFSDRTNKTNTENTFKIGNLTIPKRVCLAPMLGVNCTAFRLMCHNYGAGLIYSPMIHSVGIVKGEENRENNIDFIPQERPIAAQIVGRDPIAMVESLQYIESYCDIIDINFGCPDKDILGQKMGAYFSKHPEQMSKIVSKIVEHASLPVTAKIRIGWDSQTLNQNTQVKILEDCGVSAIAIHGRTTKQKYSGKANWESIKQAKEKSSIPIIGNGDIWEATDAKKMIEHTGCDAVMIGRGSLGNPYVFKQCNSLLEQNKNLPALNDQQRGEILKEFIELYKDSNVQKIQRFTELKQQVMWFCTGSRGAAGKRRELMQCNNEEEVNKKIKKLFF